MVVGLSQVGDPNRCSLHLIKNIPLHFHESQEKFHLPVNPDLIHPLNQRHS